MKISRFLVCSIIFIAITISITLIMFTLYSTFRTTYVDNRCRESGYEWGTYHDTTFKCFCYGKVEIGYGYIPFKDAVK